MPNQQQNPAPYRVLARKYRPRDFSGLIGQEPMVRTLKNAFEAGRIAQAWMLTGVRGVGKTSTARILARALNYQTDAVDAPTIDLSVPGNHCDAIMEGRHVDVLEMDAASHTGIDDIKQIIDGVRYAPVSARYKVYIIDEVHMLSEKAFNALLKTLEEPPPHVKFIFATTEIRKVPVTILSRCQRFDLRRIDAGMLVSLLRDIAEKEGIEADDAALAMIARAAEGSARDSLSLLDQAIAHGSGHVGAEAVQAMLGLADRSRLVELYAKLMAGDIVEALTAFRGLYDFGADPVVVLNDLAAFNHLVTRLRFVPSAGDDAALPASEVERAREFAEKLDVRHLSRTWQMLLKGITETETAPRPVDAAEMVLIRIAHAADLPTLDEVIRRADEVGVAQQSAPQAPSNGSGRPSMPASSASGAADAFASSSSAPVRQGGEPVASAGGAQTARLVASDPEAYERPRAEPERKPLVPVLSLEDIVRLAEEKRDLQFRAFIRQYVRLASIEPGRLAIGLAEEAPKTLMNDLSRKLKDWTGINWVVTLDRDATAKTLAEIDAAARESAVADAGADPDVAAALAAFPGARIIDVRLRDAAAADMAAGFGAGDIETAPEPAESGDDD
ncbi:MAG: DNA polymerase III subunit gamma/tau [Brucellaceae bacterium]|nr:DNA polymerase III subunit gamma/tau [Brucellaceae bacterium]